MRTMPTCSPPGPINRTSRYADALVDAGLSADAGSLVMCLPGLQTRQHLSERTEEPCIEAEPDATSHGMNRPHGTRGSGSSVYPELVTVTAVAAWSSGQTVELDSTCCPGVSREWSRTSLAAMTDDQSHGLSSRCRGHQSGRGHADERRGGKTSGCPDAGRTTAPHRDREARWLITALAGLVTRVGGIPRLPHAGPLRGGLKSLQLAFREASADPEELRSRASEKYTGPVCNRPHPASRRHRISSPHMTVTTRPLSRPTTPYPWVPRPRVGSSASSATLSLDRQRLTVRPVAGTASPPRFVNNYISQLPRHELRLGVRAGPAGCRARRTQRIAWVGPADLLGRRDRGTSVICYWWRIGPPGRRRTDRPGGARQLIVLLLLARKRVLGKVRRAALFKAAAV